MRIPTLLLIGLTLLAGGCATSVNVRHDPIYRAEAHSSTITATARNNQVGISSISIEVTTGEMTACGDLLLLPSVVPCRANATTVVQGCVFVGAPASASCSHTQNLTDRRLVTYRVTAHPVSGGSVSTTPVTYAGGTPLTQAALRLPLGGTVTIPWEVARPIAWHQDPPSGTTGTAADRIDVGFFPDSDYGTNYRTFTDQLQPIVLGAFYNTTDAFAQDYTLWRRVHNLWAGPFGADANGCTRSFGGLASNVSAATDGDAIVHNTDFRDCAAIALGGGGSVFGRAGDPAWLFVHESGHFLHGLGDQYCCDGGYFSVSNPLNVYASQTACQNAATALGLATTTCMRINPAAASPSWHIDIGQLETMRDRISTSDFRAASERAVSNRISACLNGSCY